MDTIAQAIAQGTTILGIELGSTRIKSVLIDETHNPIASGAHEWENRLENGIWTYRMEDVWAGLQNSFRALAQDVHVQYGIQLNAVAAIGVSGMMHGYLPFNAQDEQLAPFRTWRNTITGQAAAALTEEFGFNIPQRWSVAHLYHDILNDEAHVKDIAFLTTLAGYVHWKLTGEKVLGVGDASGMFPIDSDAHTYHGGMLAQFDALVQARNYTWKLADILPQVRMAGEPAGILTQAGATLLDPSGILQAGIPMCAPEGDAGTGMVATNSVAKRTGNVSAGTSIFAMIVLERALSKVYEQIDMVTTPSGSPVAMVHCNNCTSDLDAWVALFGEATEAMGIKPDKSALYSTLYRQALIADADCGGLLAFNYLSSEHITGLKEGRPLLARMPNGSFTLANVMRTLLFSAFATLRIGMDILTEREHVRLNQILAHGGIFRTKGVGQRMMAAALRVPVTVMQSAGEGGAWGIALLGAYMCKKEETQTLEAYLNDRVFAENPGECMEPEEADMHSFEAFLRRYQKGLPLELAAVEHL